MSKTFRRRIAWQELALVWCFSLAAMSINAATKVKLHGYLTGRGDANTLLILDDRIELTSASRVLGKDATGSERTFKPEELSPGNGSTNTNSLRRN